MRPQPNDSHTSEVRAGGPKPLGAGVCLFSAGERAFVLDTSLVGEVTSVPALMPVPRVPPAVLGLFSLRGTPVAVVDLLVLLGQASTPAPVGDSQILVVRTAEAIVAGLRISKLRAVLPAGVGRPVPAETREHPAMDGLFEIEGRPIGVLLDGPRLLTSLRALGFTHTHTTEAAASRSLE
jgi:chemotaxis signal transduction protein